MSKETDTVNFQKEGTTIDSDETMIDALAGELEKDSPADSPTEDNQTDTNPSQEGDQTEDSEATVNTSDDKKQVPFHEHPRWKEREDELRELRQFKEDYSQKVQNIEDQQAIAHSAELPQWWVTLYGNDDLSKQAYNQYHSHEEGMREQLLDDWRAEQEIQAQQQAESEKKWDEWVDNEVATLQAEGHSFNKNELLKVAIEMKPTDEEGNISLRRSLDILNLQKLQKDESKTERKKVAAATTSDNKGAGVDKTVAPNPNSLRYKSFQSLARE